MATTWSINAEQDFDDNISHIAEKSLQNAMHVLETITALADGLGDMPYKYPKEPVYNAENIRFVAKWNFKIIYRVEPEHIYILRIFNTSQHPRKTKE